MVSKFRRYQVEEVAPKNDKKVDIDPLTFVQNKQSIGGGARPTTIDIRKSSTGMEIALTRETA